MNVTQRGRATLAAVAATVLFCALAAVGLAAGARLSAGAASPSLPPTLAPARAAVLSVTPPRPDSAWTVLRIKGERLVATTPPVRHRA